MSYHVMFLLIRHRFVPLYRSTEFPLPLCLLSPFLPLRRLLFDSEASTKSQFLGVARRQVPRVKGNKPRVRYARVLLHTREPSCYSIYEFSSRGSFSPGFSPGSARLFSEFHLAARSNPVCPAIF